MQHEHRKLFASDDGYQFVGTLRSLKNCRSHIDASHSRQPLVKGERLVRYEVNAVMHKILALPWQYAGCLHV